MDHWNELREMAEPNIATYRPPSPRRALLPDDQISDLELSTALSTAEEATEIDGFMWPSLASAATGRHHRDQTGTLQALSDNNVKPSGWTRASTHGLSSPDDAPSHINHWSCRDNPTDPSSRPYRDAKPKDQDASGALPEPPEAWEDDAVTVDQTKIPHHPNESQQDIAERINALSRQIQSHAQFCVDISKQALALANENKHLIPKASSSVASTLATYVVKPALNLPEKLRTYYPGLGGGMFALKEYEENIRRMLVCSANARDMVLAQGAVAKGSESDIKRLKDRLVEQDSVLRDSSSHLARLIKERDALKRKLEDGQGSPTMGLVSDTPSSAGVAEHTRRTSSTDGISPDTGPRRRGTEETRRDSNALADQLRELRLFVEQLSLQQVSQQNGHGSDGSDEDAASTEAEQDEEHPEWTLL